MSQQNILQAYNQASDNYAKALFDELARKPLDRMLLQQFASSNASKGRIIDLGCGPGQTTKFLTECGVTNILGTDLSPEMVAKAKQLSPAIQFEVADMLQLHYPDNSFAAAVAFYSIVHFTTGQLQTAFAEIHRVLTDKGQFLFSFHIGNEAVHRDEFFEVPVDITFYYFQPDDVVKQLQTAGFKTIDVIERYPYEGAEYPSKRAYIWVEKV